MGRRCLGHIGGEGRPAVPPRHLDRPTVRTMFLTHPMGSHHGPSRDRSPEQSTLSCLSQPKAVAADLDVLGIVRQPVEHGARKGGIIRIEMQDADAHPRPCAEARRRLLCRLVHVATGDGVQSEMVSREEPNGWPPRGRFERARGGPSGRRARCAVHWPLHHAPEADADRYLRNWQTPLNRSPGAAYGRVVRVLAYTDSASLRKRIGENNPIAANSCGHVAPELAGESGR